MERKHLVFTQAKVAGDDTGPGRLTGYASVFGGVDSYRDTIMPGAYKDTIPKFLKDGFIPWGHDWMGFPVATPEVAKEDDTGLWIEADFHTDPASQQARTLVAERLARGKSMGLSIGYDVREYDQIMVDGVEVRRLKAIDLYEVSLVLVPADDAARVADVKAAGRYADIKRALRREHLDRIISVILEALSTDDDPVDESAAAPTSDDGKSTTPPGPVAIDLAGTKLLSDLEAFLSRVKSASEEEVLAAKDTANGLMRRLGSSRMELDALLKRADVVALTHPSELRREFDAVMAQLGPIDDSHQAVHSSSVTAGSRRAG